MSSFFREGNPARESGEDVMKIAIDISPLIYGTGVSVYIKNLVESLIKIDRMNEYVLFGGSMRRMNELKEFVNSLKSENVQGKIFPLAPTLADIIWNKLHFFPIENFVGKIDVFHSSDWTQPPSSGLKVTTIHDLSPILFPELNHPKVAKSHKSRLKLVKEEVDWVIVPSKTTGEDVVKLGIDYKKMRVIPEAIEPGMKLVDKLKIDNLKKKYRIPGDYLLAVGVNQRKNTQNIIKAYEKLKSDNLKLVVIGQRHFEFGNPRGVMFLGHIPNFELATFYSGAKVLVYPSFYEGFGLPILYAFSCQTPVVTSNFGSMAEIAGNAAIQVDPKSVESITEGVLDALKNKEKLVKLGLAEAKKYSWQKTAEETLKVYKESNYK